MNGWRSGLNEYVKYAGDAFRQTEILSTQTARAMEQSFSDFFFDAMRGQLKGFEDYLNSFVVSVQRAVADMTAKQVTASMISGFSGLFSAHGNVFDRGQVLRFASGGVVSSPTLFPLGVMGEAGPEAILPLQRTRSGDLGVRVAGSDGGDVVNNYFALNISAVDTRSMAQAFDQHKRQIVGMVQEAYNKRGKKGPVG
ncbi:MAG: phage tail tape measure C-terminal domain-containing protein [Thermodesulfobacteriota bacterium]|nr:phage tail tape measure C-terminal domain-containing protein [Thermodesulfobacteriota bacterium]